MTMTETAAESREPARPLGVLAKLIKADLQLADEAAQEAAKPYYRMVGEKLIEARDSAGMTLAQLCDWSQRNFNRGRKQTLLYMSYASATAHLSPQAPHPSLHQHRKARGERQTVYPQKWHEPVKEIMDRVNVEALRQETLKREQERELQRKLALQLIDIGYKALASKLHPDKGGSREAMSRLNAVRERLKGFV